METMVVQLHQQLCQNIPLSQYSRVIGYLKRLGIYTEKELRFCFLYCRDINFNNTLNGIPFANPYTYVRLIHCFNGVLFVTLYFFFSPPPPLSLFNELIFCAYVCYLSRL